MVRLPCSASLGLAIFSGRVSERRSQTGATGNLLRDGGVAVFADPVDDDGVARVQCAGGGGVIPVARETEESLGIGKGDPQPRLHAGEIAAVEDTVGLSLGSDLKPRVRRNFGGGEIGGLRIE